MGKKVRLVLLLFFCLSWIPVAAEEAPPKTLQEAITGGKVDFDLRLRGEFVEQDGFESSQAYTERIRLGYGSIPYHGLSFYLDMEDIRTADDDRYNAAGLNANPDKAVIADPKDTELNQAYAKYAHQGLELIGGRQRIILDDHRFVGNVGWRQNEQTYDAATVKYTYEKDFSFFYSHLWDINRIFGPDADRDFKSDSHLVNISYGGLDLGKLTAFAYFLDFDNSAANSSDTYGFRFAGENSLCEELALGHVLSYATQSDAGDNPTDYDADYYLLEGSVSCKDSGRVGGGYEVLSSDNDMAAFRTPLATLHGMNGWADAFLVTPAGGLEDAYVFAAAQLPAQIKAKIYYHWFLAEESGGDYGEEIDIVLVKELAENLTVLAKFADFDGNAAFTDRTKFWLQTELKF